MSSVTYQGATLHPIQADGTTYIVSFSIANAQYPSGTTLITDPSLWGSLSLPFPGGTTLGDYLPEGTAGGYLWLHDLSQTDDPLFGQSSVPIPTNMSGSTGITFTVPIKQNYQYALLYQTPDGTLANRTGVTGLDISVVDNFSFTRPPLSDKGIFDEYNILTRPISATGAQFGSTLLSYNTIPMTPYNGISFNGEINVYKNSVQNASIPRIGATGGVTGTLVGTLSTLDITSNSRAIIPVNYDLTFDTTEGDFYMIYYPFTNDRIHSSENYVAVPPVYLPFTVDFTDFYGNIGGGFTLDLKNIKYNYKGLTAGDQVVLNGQTAGTQTLNVYVDSNNIPSVTYTSNDSTLGDKLYFKNGGATSYNFYSIPEYVPNSEEFNGSFTQTNVSNKGFTVQLTNFNYYDSNYYSIFSSPTNATGVIRVQGPNYFFKEVRYVPGVSTYSFIIDSSLPFQSGPALPYTFSFVDDDIGVRTATSLYSASWLGQIEIPEKMDGNATAGSSGATLSVLLQNFDYLDKYGYSVFDSTYIPISIPPVVTGGIAQQTNSGFVLNGGNPAGTGSIVYNSQFYYTTAVPPAGAQLTGTVHSATLTQNDGFYYIPDVSGSTGIVYFGVTGPNQFAAGTTVSGLGSPDGDSFTGTVLSSSLSGLVVNITNSVKNADPPNTTIPWTFSGFYYDQPTNGHTGTVGIVNSSGQTVSSRFSYPLGSLTGITLTTPIISGLTGYSVSFYDSTDSITRESLIPIVWSPPPLAGSLVGEKFIGTTTVLSPSSFSLTNFDYTLNNQSVIYGPTGYNNGTLNVYSDNTKSNLLYTTAVTGGTGNVYTFNLSQPITYYSSTTGATYTIIEYDSESNNFFGSDYKYLLMSATVYSGESGPTFFGGWTGGSYEGLSMGVSGPASLGFDYMYTGNAAKSVIYQLIAQVDAPIPTSQIIDVHIPMEEMSRMLVYQSAWSIIDPATGLTLQGFIGGGAYGSETGPTLDPGSGFDAQGILYGPTGLSGPNVALLLGSVLRSVNMKDGVNMNTYDVLDTLDQRFTSLNGITFLDDSDKLIESIFTTWGGMTFAGSTAPSLLTIIPAESISSISNTGMTITQLQAVMKDIDTITTPNSNFVPALSNLFAEAAAYGRADGKDIITISQITGGGGTTYAFMGPSGPSGHTGPLGGDSSIAAAWAGVGNNVYGVNFADGDSITLYITYTFARGRVFTLDPHVVTDLQNNYGFSVGNVASLVIGGKTIKLQQLNIDGSVNLLEATPDNQSGTNTRVYGIRLIAKASDSKTITRFSS
jgi:hypothetical protein